ncbi:hypothetical protein [Microbacterium halophytorum]|uniref:hypothetical protein n=1 Tax=Microbacterium halophytorum TaxID=2067568 RepID=UPI001319E043|nr:hypothetical protein [Microbacterium halophytorum]
MSRHIELPPALGRRFSCAEGRAAGVTDGRLRGPDLAAPFPGVRVRRGSAPDRRMPPDDAPARAVPPDGADGPAFMRVRERALERARDFAPIMRPGEFFSHETAALVWGGPVPAAADLERVHVAVLGQAPLRRMAGVRGHRAAPRFVRTVECDGLRVASPATTWASLGAWNVFALTALGDFLCRVHRDGVGRPEPGRPPLATPDDLARALAAGPRPGIVRLREALELIRCDSWSPRETACRLVLTRSGLPEPELNVDIRRADGRFLGCVDMAYPEYAVAVEYQGELHAESYAKDVERIAAMRAAGWDVIEVTAELYRRPGELAARVRAALRGAGWRPGRAQSPQV